ncbi:MAG: metal-dependent hydrolase [Verrucomicrobiota bacterium]
MQLTYYGHACFGVKVNGKNLLFDPFITGNELAAEVDVEAVPADYILLTHAHQDHILDAIAISKRTGAPVIAPFEVGVWAEAEGAAGAMPMNHGGTQHLDFGRVKMTNAVHSSSFPDGSYGGHPSGYVVSSAKEGEGAFYYAGDTALMADMKLIGEEGGLTFSVLPIGDHFTMGAADAVKAAALVRTDQVVGVHYDTFPPIKIDRAEALAAFGAAGVKLLLPAIGETIEV